MEQRGGVLNETGICWWRSPGTPPPPRSCWETRVPRNPSWSRLELCRRPAGPDGGGQRLKGAIHVPLVGLLGLSHPAGGVAV